MAVAAEPPGRISGERLERDRYECVFERCVAENDGGQARLPVVDAEQSRNAWAAKIEVEERHVLSGQRHRHGEVGGRCRLPLFFEGARDQDHLRGLADRCELEVHAQTTERRSARARRFGDHHEATILLELPGGRWDAAEQRQAEHRRNLVGRTQTSVERVAQEREPDAEDQPEAKSEHAVLRRAGANLDCAGRLADEYSVRGLERQERLQLVDLRAQLRSLSARLTRPLCMENSDASL